MQFVVILTEEHVSIKIKNGFVKNVEVVCGYPAVLFNVCMSFHSNAYLKYATTYTGGPQYIATQINRSNLMCSARNTC